MASPSSSIWGFGTDLDAPFNSANARLALLRSRRISLVSRSALGGKRGRSLNGVCGLCRMMLLKVIGSRRMSGSYSVSIFLSYNM